jgi:hypothetical protein
MEYNNSRDILIITVSGGEGHMREYPRVNRMKLTAVERFGELGELAEETIGRTLNISESGMLLEMVKPLPLLSKVALSVGFGDAVLHMEGEVVHLRKNEEGRIETGIHFAGITDKDRKLIRKSL